MRVWAVDYDVAVFTNLSGEHLDYHKTMQGYFDAKLRLFQWLGAVKKQAFRVVNVDDSWGRRLAAEQGLAGTLVTYGTAPDAMVRAENMTINRNGSEFTLKTPWGEAPARLGLMGRFNVSNALAAFAACGAMGITPAAMAVAAAKCCTVPGRLEEIFTNRGFQVFVDYAHTEDALRNVLGALRECKPRRLILVFGCGGNRDNTKRRPMGAAASELADYSVITSDNSRNEETADIIVQIKEGFDNAAKFEVIEDRAGAIRRALSAAGKGDIVLIAGKGHETFQEQRNTTTPFDDRQVARGILT
jgi:UDP-N-acetylmuramoyl-L-alanyl-D-glutamate--2,6-diaminopimelate ligase